MRPVSAGVATKTGEQWVARAGPGAMVPLSCWHIGANDTDIVLMDHNYHWGFSKSEIKYNLTSLRFLKTEKPQS